VEKRESSNTNLEGDVEMRTEVKLTAEQREKILKENWFSHDGRWFLKVAQELGFDVANRLNQIVARSMGKTEAKRFLIESNFGEVKKIEDLQYLFTEGCRLYYPKEHEFEFKIMDKNAILGIVTRCVAFDAVKKAGATDLYQCSCATRHGAWLEAFGLDGEAFIRKSMMKGDDICEIVGRVKEWKI
jgi:hypothetical protein